MASDKCFLDYHKKKPFQYLNALQSRKTFGWHHVLLSYTKSTNCCKDFCNECDQKILKCFQKKVLVCSKMLKIAPSNTHICLAKYLINFFFGSWKLLWHSQVSTHVALDHRCVLDQHTQITWTAVLKCDKPSRLRRWRLGYNTQ